MGMVSGGDVAYLEGAMRRAGMTSLSARPQLWENHRRVVCGDARFDAARDAIKGRAALVTQLADERTQSS